MIARRRLAVAIVTVTMACAATPHAYAQEGEGAATGCTAMAAVPWSVAGKTYRIGARAAGRSCAGANVTLTIRAAGGATLLTFASAAADLPLLFAEAATPAAMTAALRRWIDQPAPARTTRDLPAWDAGADEPKAGETIFHPEPLITRAHYAELRKWGQPAVCFLQGAESEACYALDPKTDTLTLIGTRTVPG